jgi:hypothetical protein
MLRDVAYVIEARFEVTARAQADDSAAAQIDGKRFREDLEHEPFHSGRQGHDQQEDDDEGVHLARRLRISCSELRSTCRLRNHQHP